MNAEPVGNFTWTDAIAAQEARLANILRNNAHGQPSYEASILASMKSARAIAKDAKP